MKTQTIRADKMEVGGVYTIKGEALEITNIAPLWYDKNKNTLVVTGMNSEWEEKEVRVQVNEAVQFEDYIF